MGRPKAENPCNATILAHVTFEERETVSRVARWLGLSMSEYIRMCVFGETAEHRKKIAEARKERNAA